MQKTRNWALSVALVCLTLAPCVVHAQVPSPGAPPSSDPISAYKDAGASSEQQAKIRALADDFQKSATSRVEKAHKMMIKLHDLSLEPMPDEKAVYATQDQLNQLSADLST